MLVGSELTCGCSIPMLICSEFTSFPHIYLCRFAVTWGSSIPVLTGSKFTSFHHNLYRFAITTYLAEGCECVLGHKIWQKYHCSQWQTNKLCCRRSFAHSWYLMFSLAMWFVGFDVLHNIYIQSPLNHFTTNNNEKFSCLGAPNQHSAVVLCCKQ